MSTQDDAAELRNRRIATACTATATPVGARSRIEMQYQIELSDDEISELRDLQRAVTELRQPRSKRRQPLPGVAALAHVLSDIDHERIRGELGAFFANLKERRRIEAARQLVNADRQARRSKTR